MTRRYILVKVVAGPELSAEQFQSALANSMRRSFGEFGLTRTKPKLIRFDIKKSEAIIACDRDGTEDLQAAIGLMEGSRESAITAITMRVSGTLKGLRGKQRF